MFLIYLCIGTAFSLWAIITTPPACRHLMTFELALGMFAFWPILLPLVAYWRWRDRDGGDLS